VLIISALSILEVKRKLLRKHYKPKAIASALKFIKSNTLVKNISKEICEKAAEDSHKKGLPAADGIIYRTALEENAKILTLDSDFKNLPGALILD